MAYSIPKAKRGKRISKLTCVDYKTKENNDEVGPGAYNPRNIGKKQDPQWG